MVKSLFLFILIFGNLAYGQEECVTPGQPLKVKSNFSSEFCEAINACNGYEGSDCTDAEGLFKGAMKNLNLIKAGNCGLSAEELTVISYYGSEGFQCINSFLWYSKETKPRVAPLVGVLNRALKKLPVYHGLVRRGTTLPKAVLAQHLKGAVVTYEAFTSTSDSKAFSGDDQFLIFSKSGHPIMGLTSLLEEGEVLFESHSQFKIIDIILKDKKRYYIMKEVSDKTSDKKILAFIHQQKEKGMEGAADSFVCPLDPKKTYSSILLQKVVPSLLDLLDGTEL
jgi:NAD:arginine ADP-ribosyltransferase